MMLTPTNAPPGVTVWRPPPDLHGYPASAAKEIPWIVRGWARDLRGAMRVHLTEPGGFGCWFTPVQAAPVLRIVGRDAEAWE